MAHGSPETSPTAGWTLWTCSSRNTPRACKPAQSAVQGTGMAFEVDESGVRHTVQSAVPGHYNVANLLGVIAACAAHGVPLAQAAAACSALRAPARTHASRCAVPPGANPPGAGRLRPHAQTACRKPWPPCVPGRWRAVASFGAS
jgi:hypothetical protein